VSRREKEKRDSLAALGRIAERARETPWVPKPPPKPAAPRAPPPPPRAPPPPAPPALADPAAERARLRKLEERRAKIEEEKRLRERRARELQRGATLDWRGMPTGDVPTGIRRTAFDREEPTVAQKIHDVLGEARQKEGRAKARDRGRRQGGR
jgi:hypothetical protein